MSGVTSTAPPRQLHLTPRPVAASLEELVGRAAARQAFLSSDSKSGNPFEHIVLDGQAHVLKYVHVDDDFTIRSLGDLGPRALRVWATGLMDLAPEAIEHGMVGAAGGLGRNGWGAALLMRDLSAELIPPGDDLLDPEQHHTLLDGCAALSAAAWGWEDDIGLTPYGLRWCFFGPGMIEAERRLGFPTPVPRIAAEGWERFVAIGPADVRAVVEELRHDVSPLIDGLHTTPSTFIHGDWKLGNLGIARDGRTVLIDWSYPGEGPVCHELGWYLALNRARLPESKEATIGAFRVALERHGVPTAGWWDRQLALCLLGTLVQFGWEKALGDADELGWWCDRAREGAALL
ncbi:MAG TPA: phosphotransferase [Acidimicrobiales bacterium]|nr:phosphotransferase [Acidimicrobiales bacterium]